MLLEAALIWTMNGTIINLKGHQESRVLKASSLNECRSAASYFYNDFVSRNGAVSRIPRSQFITCSDGGKGFGHVYEVMCASYGSCS